jgi:hypothetical protein
LVCEIGQGSLAVAGTSGPLQQPHAAVEAGDKAGDLIAVGPGRLQVRAGRTDFEDPVEGGVATNVTGRRRGFALQLSGVVTSARVQEGEYGEHPAVGLGGLWQVELHHDAAHVLFDRALGDP